jgi:hypothetical protein
MTRGLSKSEHLRARSRIDPLDRNPYDPCWHWLGAMNSGSPRIWTLDYDSGEKRCMCGGRAVWSISRGKSPGEMLVYRKCFVMDCVNPGHLALAKDKAEIGRKIAELGVRKGRHVAARRVCAAKGRQAQGIIDTPIEIVRAIREADKSRTHTSVGLEYGVAHQVVSNIRRGLTRRAA